MDKVCTKCKEKKLTTNFSRDARMRDGFYAWCKPCKSTASAMHAVANKEKLRKRERHKESDRERERGREKERERNA